MARKVRDASLDSRDARAKLKPRGMPYYRSVERGTHLGYRRIKGKPGTWWARFYLGKGEYAVEATGAADDQSDADGVAILDYWQAVEKTRERMVSRAHAAGAGRTPSSDRQTSRKNRSFEFLEGNRKSAVDARYRTAAFIYPALGDTECEKLTTEMLRKWHAGLAKLLPRMRTRKGKKQQHRAFDGSEEAHRRRRSSANRVLTILKAALNYAFNDGRVASDGAWRKVKPFRGGRRGAHAISERRRSAAPYERLRPRVSAARASRSADRSAAYGK